MLQLTAALNPLDILCNYKYIYNVYTSINNFINL